MADIDKLKLMLSFFEDLAKLAVKPLEDDGKVSVSDFLDASFYKELIGVLAAAKLLYEHHDEIADEIQDLDTSEIFTLVAEFNTLAKTVYEHTQKALEASQAKKLEG